MNINIELAKKLGITALNALVSGMALQAGHLLWKKCEDLSKTKEKENKVVTE